MITTIQYLLPAGNEWLDEFEALKWWHWKHPYVFKFHSSINNPLETETWIPNWLSTQKRRKSIYSGSKKCSDWKSIYLPAFIALNPTEKFDTRKKNPVCQRHNENSLPNLSLHIINGGNSTSTYVDEGNWEPEWEGKVGSIEGLQINWLKRSEANLEDRRGGRSRSNKKGECPPNLAHSSLSYQIRSDVTKFKIFVNMVLEGMTFRWISPRRSNVSTSGEGALR